MKIGIYCRHIFLNNIFGGTETVTILLATALCDDHQVEIVHHNPSLDKNNITASYGGDLQRVAFRYVKKYDHKKYFNPWQPDRELLAFYADISKPYDLFIDFEHGIPPFCYAPRGILYVLFPVTVRNKIRNFMYKQLLNRNLGSYQIKLSISEFARKWTYKKWGVDTRVIYVPVDISSDAGAIKSNYIISLGRFCAVKKQMDMLSAFSEISASSSGEWEFYCVGGLSDDSAENCRYYEKMRSFETDRRIRIITNPLNNAVRNLLGRSKIFWHATGYGEDEIKRPELSEHFGISTVEAMAAGSVPVVINKGGQPEIVQHGVNGFVWDTLDELKKYTVELMQDEQLWAKMSKAARIRAQFFSKEKFFSRFMTSEPISPAKYFIEA